MASSRSACFARPCPSNSPIASTASIGYLCSLPTTKSPWSRLIGLSAANNAQIECMWPSASDAAARAASVSVPISSQISIRDGITKRLDRWNAVLPLGLRAEAHAVGTTAARSARREQR